MNRVLVAALFALFALQAQASTTWSNGSSVRTSVATCTTGSESAPTLATQGLDLSLVGGFSVHAETAGTMTAGGVLLAYLYNPETGSWIRSPDLDLVVQALAKQSFAGFQVTSAAGRIAYVPNGVGVAVTIYVVGSAR